MMSKAMIYITEPATITAEAHTVEAHPVAGSTLKRIPLSLPVYHIMSGYSNLSTPRL